MADLDLSENEIQRAVFRHFRTRAAPGVIAFHPKNGGVHMRGRRAGINTGLGVLAGIPDVIAVHRGLCFALELKTVGGKLLDEQREALRALRAAGADADVAHGLTEALTWLEDRGLLVGRAA